MRRTVVEIQGLRKRFGVKQALDRIDLSVREGEVLGILGPTGAGKTTTLRCIAGLHRPDAGTIRLDGIDVTGVPYQGSEEKCVITKICTDIDHRHP